GARSILVWMAAHGSSPAPSLPARFKRRSAAGLSSELFRPMNSFRSHVALNILSFVAANATRSANSLLNGFLAKMVELPASISVMTYGADEARETPSTHSL